MPTRKQRRRQAKGRRHEYEIVYLDDEGNEVEADPDDDNDARAKPKPAKTAAKPAARGGRQAGAGARPARKIDPPSWQRVFRRAAIFAPVMLLVVYYLNKGSQKGIGQTVLTTAVLLLFFLPFSYYMDTVMYRQYRKRIGDPIPPRERKPRSR